MSPDHLKRARDIIARKKQQEQERGPEQRPPLPEVSPNGRPGERHDEAQKVYETIRKNSPTREKKPKKLRKIDETKRKKSPAQEFSRADFAAANKELSQSYNLIYLDDDVERVLEWLSDVGDVACDIETYGEARTKPVRRKLALSFVKGKIRLLQLSDGEEVFLLDSMLLSREAVGRVLEGMRGKRLYFHNSVFDVPRLRRHFGVDLSREDIRDTQVLSRLAHPGEWRDNPRRTNRMEPMEHTLKGALHNEGVAEIADETDHLWQEPLAADRLDYASDDVLHLIALERALMRRVEERGLQAGLDLFMRVLPVYFDQQYRGVPLRRERLESLMERYKSKIDEAMARIEEHAPEHPESEAGEAWSWCNKRKYEPEKARERFEAEKQKTPLCPGRNGALRALHLKGIALDNLRKHVRVEYLSENPEGTELLDALHQLYLYKDLLSDCKEWLKYYEEDGRLYMNVKPFSQVTGRTAYADPPLQNIPKEADEEGELSLRDCIGSQACRIVKADYASQELRILAEVVAQKTGDEALVQAFVEGDPHVIVAEKIAGHELVPGTEEYKRLRKLGKRANYGFAYGAGPKTYMRTVYEDTFQQIPEKQAVKERDAFREAWPAVFRWQREFGACDGADEDDWYTLSPLGRRRYVGQRKNEWQDKYLPNYSDRLNAPVQSAGADMLYTALALLLEDKERGRGLGAEIIITTHDEIVLEASEEEEEAAREWVEGRMREAAARFLRPELSGPDCVEGKSGPSWGGK